MRLLPRRARVAVLLALAIPLLLLFFIPLPWSRAMGLDLMNYNGALDSLSAEKEREAELQERQELMLYQAVECDGVVRAFGEGRLSFDSAVTQINAITRDRPGFEEELRICYSFCRTHRERIAHFTLLKVRLAFADDPSLLAECMKRVAPEALHGIGAKPSGFTP